jgi:hypothetical protein
VVTIFAAEYLRLYRARNFAPRRHRPPWPVALGGFAPGLISLLATLPLVMAPAATVSAADAASIFCASSDPKLGLHAPAFGTPGIPTSALRSPAC